MDLSLFLRRVASGVMWSGGRRVVVGEQGCLFLLVWCFVFGLLISLVDVVCASGNRGATNPFAESHFFPHF